MAIPLLHFAHRFSPFRISRSLNYCLESGVHYTSPQRPIAIDANIAFGRPVVVRVGVSTGAISVLGEGVVLGILHNFPDLEFLAPRSSVEPLCSMAWALA